jgi:hypothetical protein
MKKHLGRMYDLAEEISCRSDPVQYSGVFDVTLCPMQ